MFYLSIIYVLSMYYVYITIKWEQNGNKMGIEGEMKGRRGVKMIQNKITRFKESIE